MSSTGVHQACMKAADKFDSPVLQICRISYTQAQLEARIAQCAAPVSGNYCAAGEHEEAWHTLNLTIHGSCMGCGATLKVSWRAGVC
jgi:hypothetical protein